MGDRRGRGEGSIYQRKDGRWVYVLDLGWSGGKRDRRYRYAPTKKALTPKINELRRELDAGITRDGSTTVEAWLTYWLSEVAPHRVRERTLTGYKGYVNTWLIPNLGKHRLDRLEPSHVRTMLKKMAEAGKSSATIRQAYAILSRALTVAMTDGKIMRNPCASVEPPKPTAKGTHGKLTLAEAQAVLTHLREADTSVRSRWVVAIMCGLRQGEALGLDWQDVDLESRTIYVHQAQTSNGKIVPTVKSRSSVRMVPLPSEAVASLEAHRQRTGLVWGPRDNKADWKEWQAVLDAAGVGHHTVHAARATCASILAEAGVPSKVIAEILGHSTPAITESAYVHGDAVMRASALDKGERLLGM